MKLFIVKLLTRFWKLLIASSSSMYGLGAKFGPKLTPYLCVYAVYTTYAPLPLPSITNTVVFLSLTTQKGHSAESTLSALYVYDVYTVEIIYALEP